MDATDEKKALTKRRTKYLVILLMTVVIAGGIYGLYLLEAFTTTTKHIGVIDEPLDAEMQDGIDEVTQGSALEDELP